jgi:thiamine biosynthesis protein ThiS
VAVELNGAIVRKASYDATAIEPGARVEVVGFVGGG